MPKMSQDRWAIKYNECKACERSDRKHEAKGLCKICYARINLREYRRAYRDRKNFGGNRSKKLAENSSCQICNYFNDLVVHHKDRNNGNNEMSNLVTLCRSCHSGLHKYFNLRERFLKFEHLIK